jgi:hypothetical protein
VSSDTKSILSFDDRNQKDFLLVTKRIQDALDKLENDKRLKRTETNLADLAVCSRGTLRNRGWPLARLKTLKEESRASKEKPQPDPGAAGEESSIDRYKKQLAMNRDELLVWKYKHDDLLRKVQTLEAQLKTYKQRAEAHEAQIRAAAICAGRKKATITVLSVTQRESSEPQSHE